jgi:hypothetical protein
MRANSDSAQASAQIEEYLASPLGHGLLGNRLLMIYRG